MSQLAFKYTLMPKLLKSSFHIKVFFMSQYVFKLPLFSSGKCHLTKISELHRFYGLSQSAVSKVLLQRTVKGTAGTSLPLTPTYTVEATSAVAAHSLLNVMMG